MSAAVPLSPGSPSAGPDWLRPLLDRLDDVPATYRTRIPADILAAITESAGVTQKRDAAVLVLFSGPETGEPGTVPHDADLLVTVRASTLRHHAGQAAFPGGASDPGDDGPVGTALREAWEETGIDISRLRALATLERMFLPPSGYHVVPVLAFSPDPGPVAVVDDAETAIVARVPVRAFINPENRLRVYRKENTTRSAGPAFLLNEMLVWGFTGHIIAAMLDVAGWTQPWDPERVYEVEDAMALVGGQGAL